MRQAFFLTTLAFLSVSLPAMATDAYDEGYAWAQENDYTDYRDCGDDDNPFNDGCQAWVEEYEQGYDDAEKEHYTDEIDCDGSDAEEAGCATYIIEQK